jgi:Mrp family chromosome partitioning ATPase
VVGDIWSPESNLHVSLPALARDLRSLWRPANAPFEEVHLARRESASVARGAFVDRRERDALYDGLRHLHGRVAGMVAGGEHTVVAVCSALEREGKTTIAVALSELLAQDFFGETVLVDGDLERPQIHELLGLDLSPGLKDCLNGGGLLTSAVHTLDSGLRVMPAGAVRLQPTSAGLEAPRTLLRTLRNLFRITILDLPAVLTGPQPALLSLYADAVVWVVKADESPLDAVADAMDVVGRERILGVVVNGQRPRLPRWLERLV